MWTAKFKIRHKDCWISSKTKDYSVVVKGIPLSSYEENGELYNSNFVFVSGEKSERDKFVRCLKRDKRVKEMQIKGNQILSKVQGREFISTVFDESFFFIKPVVMKNGFEFWEIGCWERKKIIDFYKRVRNLADVQLMCIKKEFPSIFMQQSVPHLTEKQMSAFELAKEFGYYNYPRKISVEQLAKLKKVPRTTFQNHLRKAEIKLLNVILE